MHTQQLTQSDVESIWLINEQGLPGTGKVTLQEISYLLELSTFSLGVFSNDELLGFVICLSPGTDYGSLNYAWFNTRYDEFIYVDRIAVSTGYRDRGIGSLLYKEVVSYSNQHSIPIAAEVNLNPPNPGSMRFHERFQFEEIGILEHEDKSVTMLLRKVH
jgi:predicted GNAT superfamily acetyltransferase